MATTNPVTTVEQDATKVASTVKTDISNAEAAVKKTVTTVEGDIATDLAKTYSAKIVGIAFVAGALVALIVKAFLGL